ncbi:hypothetical protein AX774_g5596 [Zancudomyces culisetae]|uniref:Uncharacterized protein n=1 Tax=Zancudomyces culisetae TaxID=1213189 RepID=A0A1R1PJ61_ZANCU|nr:hypothetical protein AX774_g5596 [Zancudomyces culisetae]|eukprot:OMH80943.1 hypothetical protein AX774_g5596 [Zancudomyces culisetae]
MPGCVLLPFLNIYAQKYLDPLNRNALVYRSAFDNEPTLAKFMLWFVLAAVLAFRVSGSIFCYTTYIFTSSTQLSEFKYLNRYDIDH